MPERVALVCGDRRLTFAELEERANRLAHHLAGLGVATATTSGSTRRTAPSGSRRCSAASSSAPSRSTSTSATSRTSCATSSTTPTSSACVYDPEYTDRLDAIAGDLPTPAAPHRHRRRTTTPRWQQRRPTATSASAPATTSTSSTRAAPRACPRASCGARRTCSSPSARASTPPPDTRSRPTTSSPRRAPPAFPLVLLITPPLMHGAAQWGTLGQLAQGNTVVLMPRFDAEEVWRIGRATRSVNSVLIAGDAMGRPMIEALEAGPGPLGPVVAVRRHLARRAVLRAGEGALLRAASRT